jgi:hypothetical protein
LTAAICSAIRARHEKTKTIFSSLLPATRPAAPAFARQTWPPPSPISLFEPGHFPNGFRHLLPSPSPPISSCLFSLLPKNVLTFENLGNKKPRNLLGYGALCENGAGEETRTLDVHLGKVVLYQLSYACDLRGH